ncbi:DUF3617 domain-containing protein [Erythrobacter sp.]|uniref:DUF3617 domain-containing protein n=1 Tax=Erythrobacter sp. TaxID=1042 RepID=UPI0031200172
MRRIVLAAMSTLALAGCGSPSADADGDGEITMSEAVDKSKELVKPEPGKYRNTVQLVNLELPGAPKDVQDMMKQMMGKEPRTTEYCLTKEEAEKGFEEMAKQAQEDEDCSFEKFDAEGGKIDAIMNCKADGKGTARMTLQGTGTRTSSQMTMTIDAKGPDGNAMMMTMKSNQERIGDCDG